MQTRSSIRGGRKVALASVGTTRFDQLIEALDTKVFELSVSLPFDVVFCSLTWTICDGGMDRKYKMLCGSGASPVSKSSVAKARPILQSDPVSYGIDRENLVTKQVLR
jgi:hypothetical protein